MERLHTMLREAEQTNTARDAIDREHGFAPTSALDPRELLRVIESALHAGIETQDWRCVAEAAVFLADLTGNRPWKESK